MGDPQKCMVQNGESHLEMDDLGVTPHMFCPIVDLNALNGLLTCPRDRSGETMLKLDKIATNMRCVRSTIEGKNDGEIMVMTVI